MAENLVGKQVVWLAGLDQLIDVLIDIVQLLLSGPDERAM